APLAEGVGDEAVDGVADVFVEPMQQIAGDAPLVRDLVDDLAAEEPVAQPFGDPMADRRGARAGEPREGDARTRPLGVRFGLPTPELVPHDRIDSLAERHGAPAGASPHGY